MQYAGEGSARGQVAFQGVYDCLRHAYSDTGVRGLFRGAGARVMHFTPATTVTMTTYETCRLYIGNVLA